MRGVIEVAKNGMDAKDGFVFPSYFEDIIGAHIRLWLWALPLGLPSSGNPEDLKRTDRAALACIDPDRRPEDRDNYVWIRDAEANQLVVGSQARILYQDGGGAGRPSH